MASIRATGTFTAVAASHTAGDSVGGAVQLLATSQRDLLITSASLTALDATVIASAFRLYLFDVTPPSALADDGAFTLAAGDRASFLGYIDLGTPVDLGATQYIEVNGINKMVNLPNGTLFGYLVNLTTVTPAAVGHVVTLNCIPV